MEMFNRSGSPFNPSHSSLVTSAFAYDTLFNGNISAWTLQNRGNAASSSNKYEQLTGHRFRYDQLNRIKTNTFSNNNGSWQSTTDFRSAYTYDANGNILSLNRNAYAPTLGMDSLTYTYETIANGYSSNTNKLRHVDDAVASGNYAVDIDDQAANNYKYDAIGNLIEDVAENIDSIYWTVYGKVKAVVKTSGDSLYFRYDPAGNRVMKEDYGADTVITFYVRDASGNPMATYERTRDGDEYVYTLKELPIYGSDRIGLKRPDMEIARRSTTDAECFTCEPYKFPYNTLHYHGYYTRAIDKKDYEATDHLSNQRVIFSDRKNADSTAVVRSYNNYYPFGMLQPARNYQSAEGYRYGFNSQEKVDEVKGSGNWYDYGLRPYDPRIGRPPCIDPLARQYPELSPYQFYHNNPIRNVDLDGAEGLLNELFNRAKTYGVNLIKTATYNLLVAAAQSIVNYGEAKVEEKKQELLKQPGTGTGVLLFEFASGTGPSQREFGPESPLSQALRDAPKVNQAREMFLNKNAENIKEGKTLDPLTDFGGSFGLKGLVKAGTDITEQFVGSFDVNIYPSDDGKTAIFIISNTTSVESLLYGAGPEYERSGNTPGGNIRQTFVFTEPIAQPEE